MSSSRTLSVATAALLALAVPLTASAGEGMWLPEQIPSVAEPHQATGLAIDPEVLADPLEHPLGAIVTMGFCSASFVSEDGLMLTNHHCVSGYLQQNSTAEANLFRDGFTATSRDKELPAGPGARVRVVESITDVTAQVTGKIRRRTKDARRYQLIEDARKRLVAECEREANRRCAVVSYFGSSTYRLIKTRELSDVRLVAVPPRSVGQFGGDIDNWMWPRHGADFAVLRAYVAKDGTTAPYSEDNVPYAPAHHLTLNPNGPEPGGFVMAAGFPGRTSRHSLAETLRWYAEDYMPKRQRFAVEVAGILQGYADADPDAAARLGSPISSLQNGIKNSEGLVDGLSRGGLIAQKAKDEAALMEWLDQDPKRARWKADIVALQEISAEGRADAEQELYVQWMYRTADLLGVARRSIRWAEERQKKTDLARERGYQDRDLDRIKEGFARMERAMHLPSDRDAFGLVLRAYSSEASTQARVPALDRWLAEHGGVDGALDYLYDGETALTTTAGRVALLDQDLDSLRDSEDPWLELAGIFIDWDRPRRDIDKARSGAQQRLSPSWYAALEAWTASKGGVLYDDANSSLRVTMGTVKGYSPQDGLVATPFTSAKGFAAKVGEAPFDAPESLQKAALDASGHRFADPELGDVPVNFLTDLDTTGGNSGSAVMDGEGRLVGLLFDGNYEAIASDWVFVDPVTRSICMDVRWMGFVLDHTEGAEWVMEELGLQGDPP